MADKPKQRGRTGKTAVQSFIAPAIHARFKAACALAERDASEVVEELMTKFADAMKIPTAATAKK